MKLEAGAPIEAREWPPITRELLRDYAQASGDFNPIHLDESAARGAGLPGIIAHGMLSAALIGERAREFMEETSGPGCVLSRIQTRFKAMVLVGDVISVSGSVKELSDREVVLELAARTRKGEVATTGTVRYCR